VTITQWHTDIRWCDDG